MAKCIRIKYAGVQALESGLKKQEEIKEQRLRAAQDYLNANFELRKALDIPAGTQLDCKPLGAGEHNDNYVFSNPETQEKFVLRINTVSQNFHSDQVSYEEYALKILQVSGRVPQVLYRDSSLKKIDRGVLVISFCEGSELNFDALRPGDLLCATQLMADIHAVEIPQNCRLYCPKNAMQELFDECVNRYKVYEKSAFTNNRITHFAEQFITKAQDMLQKCPALPINMRIINTETLPSHFLISDDNAREAECAFESYWRRCINQYQQGAQVASHASTNSGVLCKNPGYFIDWERPIIGDIAQDLAYFVAPTTTFWDSNYYFPQDDVEGFLQNYWRAVDGRFSCPDFEERFRVWQALTAMRSTTWCCRAYALCKGDPQSSLSAKVREKLQVYLSDEFLNMLLEDYFI